jgi:hypothetical protein
MLLLRTIGQPREPDQQHEQRERAEAGEQLQVKRLALNERQHVWDEHQEGGPTVITECLCAAQRCGHDDDPPQRKQRADQETPRRWAGFRRLTLRGGIA